MKIHLDSLIFNPTHNKRELDLAHVASLAEQIAKYGLLTSLTARKGAKVDKELTYIGSAGYHRHAAITKLRGLTDDQIRKLGTRIVDGEEVPGRTFEELFPEGMVDVIVVDSDIAEAAVAVENTARKDYTQAELCVLVWELDDQGVDQHEIASRCTMNQGRVSEFLSLRKAIPQAHDAWGDGHIAMRDMLSLATLPEDKQKEHLEKIVGSTDATEASTKAGRQAKAEARKGLLNDAKETRRGYANAGKPSRKRIATLSERIAKAAKSGTEASKGVMSIVDKAFSFINGGIDEKSFARFLNSYDVQDVFTDPVVEKPAKAKAKKATTGVDAAAKVGAKVIADAAKAGASVSVSTASSEKKAKPAKDKPAKAKAEKKDKPAKAKAEKKAKPAKDKPVKAKPAKAA